MKLLFLSSASNFRRFLPEYTYKILPYFVVNQELLFIRRKLITILMNLFYETKIRKSLKKLYYRRFKYKDNAPIKIYTKNNNAFSIKRNKNGK
jgi:hypothetical protein